MNKIIQSFYENQLTHLKSVRNSINNGKLMRREIVKDNNPINLYDKYGENYQKNNMKPLEGDKTVVKFLKFLYNVKGFDWFDYQLMLIPHLLNATLKTIYKSEWDNNSGRIKEQFELEKVNK